MSGKYHSPAGTKILCKRNKKQTNYFNSLPNDKILDLSKLKAFADGKINVTLKLKIKSGRVEKIVGKGENAGNKHFLLFPQCFQKASYSVQLYKCLPNNKILDWSELKEFTDNTLTHYQTMTTFDDSGEETF